MITLRKAEDRGHLNFGWLDTYHVFSFGQYHDPKHMGFKDLRVINDDKVAAGAGFPTHPHANMEIVTYVLKGAVAHKDSMGNVETIQAGEVQCMSAGTGITHSEFNPSPTEELHLLQIWILPEAKGITPTYSQGIVEDKLVPNEFTTVLTRTGEGGTLSIHQDVNMGIASIQAGGTVSYKLNAGRAAWFYIAEGEAELQGQGLLKQGDSASAEASDVLSFVSQNGAKVVVFEMAE